MSRPVTTRLKVNPPLGRMPVLQFVQPAELRVDETYQRSLDTGTSQTLIRKIAQHWNWDLCQPLVVARRDSGDLYVIDGQHRLAAANLRRDIAQLPCVVLNYASAADEAASFVHLNQQRRPLTKLDIFKAAVASADPEACAILNAIEGAGLSVAPHSNYTAWKPGMVSNIGGIETAWRGAGQSTTSAALEVLARAWRGEVLRYAGTVFPGIVAVCGDADETKIAFLAKLIGRATQSELSRDIIRRSPDCTGGRREAARLVIEELIEGALSKPVKPAPLASSVSPAQTLSDGKRWCDQCDMRVHLTAAATCKSRYCTLRPRLTA